MALRFFFIFGLLAGALCAAGCGTDSRASGDDLRPTAFYVIAAPSGQQRTCRLQAELAQHILTEVMRPGDSLRFAVGHTDVADFAFAPGVELGTAARQDKIRPDWQRVRQHYQAAAQFGGPDKALDVAVLLPRIVEWAEARPKEAKVVVLVGRAAPPQSTAPTARERAVLGDVVVHMIHPEGEQSPEELRDGRTAWERFLAERGACLVTYSTSRTAYERLKPEVAASLRPEASPKASSEPTTETVAKPGSHSTEMVARPVSASASNSPKPWRVRIQWLDRSTDYDLCVRHELAGDVHSAKSAASHQRNRLPRNWEEVELETLTGAELVEIRLFDGHADPGLSIEVRQPNGRLLKTTEVGFLFRDARGDGRHVETRTVVMMDLLPRR